MNLIIIASSVAAILGFAFGVFVERHRSMAAQLRDAQRAELERRGAMQAQVRALHAPARVDGVKVATVLPPTA